MKNLHLKPLTLCLSLLGFYLILNAQMADPNPSFEYSSLFNCTGNFDLEVTILGDEGGSFSAIPSGLDIHSNTGYIDLSESLNGEFEISYTLEGKGYYENYMGSSVNNGSFFNPQNHIGQSVVIQHSGVLTHYYPCVQAELLEIRDGGPTGTLLYSEVNPPTASHPDSLNPMSSPVNVSEGQIITLLFYNIDDYNIRSTLDEASTGVLSGNYIESSDGSTWTSGSYIPTEPAWLSGTAIRVYDPGAFTSSSQLMQVYGPDASFEYDNSIYCQPNDNVTPNILGDEGGYFWTFSDNLELNSATGELDINSSQAGSHSVYYDAFAVETTVNEASSGTWRSDFYTETGMYGARVAQSFTPDITGILTNISFPGITGAAYLKIFEGENRNDLEFGDPIYRDMAPSFEMGNYELPTEFLAEAGQRYSLLIDGYTGTIEACDDNCYSEGVPFYYGTINGVEYEFMAASNWDLRFSVNIVIPGCSMTQEFPLTISTPSAGTDTRTECFAYTWIDDLTYTSSNNTATYTLPGAAASGCDSIVTLNLTIDTVNTATSISGATISSEAQGASYRWLDCDNSMQVIEGENNQSFTPNTNGNYAVEVTQNGCSDISDCVSIVGLTVEENNLNQQFVLYPNPAQNQFHIEFEEVQEHTSIDLRSLSGQTIQSKTLQGSSRVNMQLRAPAGIYFVEITDSEGGTSRMKLVIQ